MHMEENELQQTLVERFQTLPKTVQDAVTSADVQARMRELAGKHKLHVDKWALLENEVMLTMLGLEKTNELAKNIAKEIDMPQEAAEALAADISKVVFEPIRAEMEKITAELMAEEAAHASESSEQKPAAAPILAATPPRAAPQTTIERAPASNSYGAAAPSHERKTIEGDPYREQTS